MAIQDKFNRANVIYKITSDIDLDGGNLIIPEGCTLDFQGGNVKNGCIVLKSGTTLKGIGSTLIERGLTLGYSECIRIEGNNIVIQGIKFRSNVSYNHSSVNDKNIHVCIQGYYSSNVLIDNCSFEKTNACVAFDSCNNIEVKDCSFKESYENIHSLNYGYGVVLNQVDNAKVHHCNFIDIERHAFYISCHAEKNAINSTNINIHDNYIKALDAPFKTGAEAMCKTICGDNINFTRNTIIGGIKPFLISISVVDGGSINICDNITIGDKHNAFIEMYPQHSDDHEKSVKNINITGNKAYLNSDEYPVFCHFANISGQCLVENNIAVTPRGGYAFRIKTESEYTQSVAKTGSIRTKGNVLKGFNGGYYVNNIASFISEDYISPYVLLLDGKKYWRACEAIENVVECKVFIKELTLNDYMDIKSYPNIVAFGTSYYDKELQTVITCVDTSKNLWVNSLGELVVGNTDNRPHSSILSKGFRYYDTEIKHLIIFDGYDWVLSDYYAKIPNVIYDGNLPLVGGYSNDAIYDVVNKQPVWFDPYYNVWKTANGMPIDKIHGNSSNRPSNIPIGGVYFDTSLNKPIWWTGAAWVDANGTEV